MHTCSFCQKERTEDRRLFYGPGVRICNECVELFTTWDDHVDVATDKAAILDGLDLSDSDRRLVALRFGFDGHMPHGTKEIAEILGTSVEEATVQVADAIQVLRALQK